MARLADEHFSSYVRYNRGFESYLATKPPPSELEQPPRVVVCYGETGTGKTHDATRGTPIYRFTRPSSRGTEINFDLFNGERRLLLDEFYGWVPIDLLLRLCDRYPVKGNQKGKSCWLSFTETWITSNCAPDAWYRNVPHPVWSAFLRRVSEWRLYGRANERGHRSFDNFLDFQRAILTRDPNSMAANAGRTFDSPLT